MKTDLKTVMDCKKRLGQVTLKILQETKILKIFYQDIQNKWKDKQSKKLGTQVMKPVEKDMDNLSTELCKLMESLDNIINAIKEYEDVSFSGTRENSSSSATSSYSSNADSFSDSLSQMRASSESVLETDINRINSEGSDSSDSSENDQNEEYQRTIGSRTRNRPYQDMEI